MRIFFFPIFLLLFSACSREEHIDCDPIIISEDQYNELNGGFLSVIDATLDEDCLQVQLRFGGCDSIHRIDMITKGIVVAPSFTSVLFGFRDNDPQLCNRVVSVSTEFDIQSIREDVMEDIS